jgi:hypothetical protein
VFSTSALSHRAQPLQALRTGLGFRALAAFSGSILAQSHRIPEGTYAADLYFHNVAGMERPHARGGPRGHNVARYERHDA